MPRGVYKRRQNQNIRVNGKKICLNPNCWEEIPENKIYCSPECSYACKILKQKTRRKNRLFKYQKEHKVGVPAGMTRQGKHPPHFDY